MPRTALTVTQATRAGVALPAATAGDVANGNSVANNGRVILLVTNTNASTTARTITFNTVRTVDGLTAPERVESIPAGETQLFGPFDPTDYGPSLAIDPEHAEVTIQAIRV
ncbi:hypothetical protein GCM10010400_76810 [Streptomyces aculeolatus]|uniref:hypothetical protein n=1 Tax=Streptomyces aculeolatus TaxID=270689 RepID=UPI001CECF883|nr:hypothetical protein [Streptomyces aculeolatus]